MRLTKIRLKKEYRLKVWGILFIVFVLGYYLIPKANRLMVFTYFNTKCRNYRQVVYSKKLSDRIVDYYSEASKGGITTCKTEADIKKLVRRRELFKVSSRNLYLVADMDNSYPYATKETRKLISEVGRRFKKKISSYGLKGSRFFITSLTRTTDNVRDLKKTNGNVSDNSPHMNGNAFDISYARFSYRKVVVTSCDEWYMKEALAEVIWQLREEKKCWATYEKNQGCFHIVTR